MRRRTYFGSRMIPPGHNPARTTGLRVIPLAGPQGRVREGGMVLTHLSYPAGKPLSNNFPRGFLVPNGLRHHPARGTGRLVTPAKPAIVSLFGDRRSPRTGGPRS